MDVSSNNSSSSNSNSNKSNSRSRKQPHLAPPLLLLLLFFTSAPSAAAASGGTEVQKAYGGPPCVYDAYGSFTYMHIGYVPYFNTSNRLPTFCTTDQCLDLCTSDCSCTAIVYDVPHDSCFIYHDIISVSSIQLLPVFPRDTMSAYVKVQRGSPNHRGYYYSAASPRMIPLPLLGTAIAAIAALL